MHAIVAVAMLGLMCVAPSGGRLHEPECSSFTVMEKLLEKMIKVEFNTQTVQASMLQWEAKMEALLAKASVNMDAWQTRLDSSETSLQTQTTTIEKQLEEALLKQKHELQAMKAQTTTTLEAAEQRLETKETEVTSQLAAALLKNQEDLKTFQEAYQTPTVVFTAKDANSVDVKRGRNIIFPNVLNNVGDGYDKNTGVFTAPHTGLYSFTTTVCGQKSEHVVVYITAAGTNIASAHKYNTGYVGTCASTSGMVVLNKKDTVSVKGTTTHNGAMYTGGSERWPSFAGMLVHKT